MPRPPSPGGISSPFGWRIHPITGVRTHHNGQDHGWGNGTIIVAPEDGEVVSYSLSGGYGNLMKFAGATAEHWLAHLSAARVLRGRVAEGTPIATMGNTGLSTAMHLHWETRVGGVLINPADWLARHASAGGTPFPEEEDMPLDNNDLIAILNASFPNGTEADGKTRYTSVAQALRAVYFYGDKLYAQNLALTAAVTALSGAAGADPATINKIVQDAVREAVGKITVEISE